MLFQRNRINLLFVFLLCLAVVLPTLSAAQRRPNATAPTTPPDTTQAPDQLRRLKQALSDAGATALTTAQETALTTLITNFQTANKPTPSATRIAYDNYILAGNADQAIALIPILQEEQGAQALARQQAEVNFAVNAVQLLTADQVNALQQDLGSDELVHLIQSLAGPGGPGGPPMH
jgi:Spy/CpxP family protein refolding chaperone